MLLRINNNNIFFYVKRLDKKNVQSVLRCYKKFFKIHRSKSFSSDLKRGAQKYTFYIYLFILYFQMYFFFFVKMLA